MPATRATVSRYHGLLWVGIVTLAGVMAHALAVAMTRVTIGMMRAVSDFAIAVRAHDLEHLPYYNGIAFPLLAYIVLAYLWPLVRYCQDGCPQPAPPLVKRRVLSGPLVMSMASFVPWLCGIAYFVYITHHHFGRWSPELASQHVFSPLVSGFLASTTTYLVTEWIIRVRFVPVVFPQGELSGVAGARSLGVRARLLILMTATAFTPLFTMLGLVVAAHHRVAGGQPAQQALANLGDASQRMFVFFILLGVALTLLLARSLTQPLGLMARALRKVQSGDLSTHVQVESNDEIGLLEEGVNAMVTTLREKEHILDTFGHLVEPRVRDRLLAGDIKPGGEIKLASVLFVDLRGFTSFSERSTPGDMVATLNSFFGLMNGWVRECGGFVDKFIGDAMLAIFGLFEEGRKGAAERGAAAAINCALGMQERLSELNRSRAASNNPPLAITASVHTGNVLAGTIGAEDRHEYTVIGDTVNVAARMLELCKEEGNTIVASAESVELARRQGVCLSAKTARAVTLRGRAKAVHIFTLA